MKCPRCSQPGYTPPPTSNDPLVECTKCGWPDSRVPHLRIEHLATRAELVRRKGWAGLTDPQLYAITLAWMQAEENDRLTTLQLRIADRQNETAEKQLQIAEAQRDAAYASAAWTKAQGIATTVATVIALAALLIAVL